MVSSLSEKVDLLRICSLWGILHVYVRYLVIKLRSKIKVCKGYMYESEGLATWTVNSILEYNRRNNYTLEVWENVQDDDFWTWEYILGFPGGLHGKESVSNTGDLGSIPGFGSSPGEGNGNPLQYSCLENSKDREASWVTVHGVAKSQTRLSD